MFFLELSCFFHDPADVGNLISGSLPFLKPAWTSGSSQFTYCWSLAWRILSITLLVCPSNEYSELISFRVDWLDLLALQGTFRSLLQHHNLKASILQCSRFFMVQLSCPYMTTIKIIPLIIQNFVSKVMCLLFNMLCVFVIAILSRSKCLLISCLQSLSQWFWSPRK